MLWPGVVRGGRSIIYAPKDFFARRVISCSDHRSTNGTMPNTESGTMMEGSSSSATAIEHGSEDAAPLIRPGGGGGGVTSALPVEIERLGKMYVVSFCCWGLC